MEYHYLFTGKSSINGHVQEFKNYMAMLNYQRDTNIHIYMYCVYICIYVYIQDIFYISQIYMYIYIPDLYVYILYIYIYITSLGHQHSSSFGQTSPLLGHCSANRLHLNVTRIVYMGNPKQSPSLWLKMIEKHVQKWFLSWPYPLKSVMW